MYAIRSYYARFDKASRLSLPSSSAAASPGASTTDFDLLVVGGGINGAGIARDAAGRGLHVLLVERGDIAGASYNFV